MGGGGYEGGETARRLGGVGDECGGVRGGGFGAEDCEATGGGDGLGGGAMGVGQGGGRRRGLGRRDLRGGWEVTGQKCFCYLQIIFK